MSADLALERAGFTVTHHNNDRHWVLRGRGLRVDYWPTVGKFQVFGKVFRASVSDFIQSVRQGQYARPTNSPSQCNRCHAPIYWVKPHNGKWMPLDSDGGPHMAHCRRVQ